MEVCRESAFNALSSELPIKQTGAKESKVEKPFRFFEHREEATTMSEKRFLGS